VFSGAGAHTAAVEADVMAEAAIHYGVPAERIIREPRALTTWQNVRFSFKLLKARGLRTLLIISTSDHLPRARRILHYYGQPDERMGWAACDLDMPAGEP
jgi:uncharacterized SAM-binding protein YcdF (DUF218 family)